MITSVTVAPADMCEPKSLIVALNNVFPFLLLVITNPFVRDVNARILSGSSALFVTFSVVNTVEILSILSL